jgi:hypothetical protein
MSPKIKRVLLMASVFASLPFYAFAQQASSGSTTRGSSTTSGISNTSAGSVFQSQIGGGSAPRSAGPNLPPVPTFNAINSAPTRNVLTPGGASRGAGPSTDIVCDLTDFSGGFGNAVDVCR